MNSKIICGNFFYNVFSLKFKWIAFVQVTVGRDQKTWLKDALQQKTSTSWGGLNARRVIWKKT